MNISAKKYLNRLIYVAAKASDINVVFFETRCICCIVCGAVFGAPAVTMHLWWGTTPRIAPSHRAIGASPHVVRWAHPSPQLSIGSSVFVGLTLVSNRHTDRQATRGVARRCGGCGPHRAALARGGKRAKIVFKDSRENSDCNFSYVFACNKTMSCLSFLTQLLEFSVYWLLMRFNDCGLVVDSWSSWIHVYTIPHSSVGVFQSCCDILIGILEVLKDCIMQYYLSSRPIPARYCAEYLHLKTNPLYQHTVVLTAN